MQIRMARYLPWEVFSNTAMTVSLRFCALISICFLVQFRINFCSAIRQLKRFDHEGQLLCCLFRVTSIFQGVHIIQSVCSEFDFEHCTSDPTCDLGFRHLFLHTDSQCAMEDVVCRLLALFLRHLQQPGCCNQCISSWLSRRGWHSNLLSSIDFVCVINMHSSWGLIRFLMKVLSYRKLEDLNQIPHIQRVLSSCVVFAYVSNALTFLNDTNILTVSCVHLISFYFDATWQVEPISIYLCSPIGLIDLALFVMLQKGDAENIIVKAYVQPWCLQPPQPISFIYVQICNTTEKVCNPSVKRITASLFPSATTDVEVVHSCFEQWFHYDLCSSRVNSLSPIY